GAPAGSGGEIDITLSAAIGDSDIMQVTYEEYSGIATSSCSDGSSSAVALAAGAMNPGSITTTSNGDLITTFGIDGTANQNNTYPAGIEMPDDNSVVTIQGNPDNDMTTMSIQSTAGSINPTLNVCAMDIGQQDTWQLVAQAFKASSGAGTQPPSGRATMVRDQVIWSLPQEISLSLLAAPTNGNVIVVASSQFQN